MDSMHSAIVMAEAARRVLCAVEGTNARVVVVIVWPTRAGANWFATNCTRYRNTIIAFLKQEFVKVAALSVR